MVPQVVLEFPIQVFQFGVQPVQMGLDAGLQVEGYAIQAGLLLGTQGDHLPPSHHKRMQSPQVGVGKGSRGQL